MYFQRYVYISINIKILALINYFIKLISSLNHIFLIFANKKLQMINWICKEISTLEMCVETKEYDIIGVKRFTIIL